MKQIVFIMLMLIALITSCRKEEMNSSPELQEGELCVLASENIDLSSLSDTEDHLIPFKLSPKAYYADVVFPDDISKDDQWAYIFDFEDNEEDIMWLFVEANETGAPRKASIQVYGWDVAVSTAGLPIMTRAEAASKAQIADTESFVQNGDPLKVNISKRYGTGYGFDLSKTMDTEALRGAVINLGQLKNETKQPMLEDGTSESSEVSYTGTSQKDIASKLEVKAEAEASYLAFSGEMQASFGTSKSKSQYNEYGILIKTNRMAYWAISEEYDVQILRSQYLSEPFKLAIGSKDFDPANIIKIFGTHVVTRASVGARINYSITLDRTKATNSMDIGASLKVGFKTMVASGSSTVSAEQKQAFEENKNGMTIRTTCAGGGPNAQALVSNQDIKQWEANLSSRENWAAIGFNGPNALIPLWEFVEDATRREALKTAIISYINNQWGGGEGATVQLVNTQNIKWSDDNRKKTSIKVLKNESGVPFAEVCLEYIPNLSRDKRVEVIYPLNVEKKPIYNRGFFLGNENKSAGYIDWDLKTGLATYETSESYPEVGRIDTIYIHGYTFAHKTTDKTSRTRIEDVFIDYPNFNAEDISTKKAGLVKIGNTIVTQGFLAENEIPDHRKIAYYRVFGEKRDPVGEGKDYVVSSVPAYCNLTGSIWRYEYSQVISLVPNIMSSSSPYFVLTKEDFEAIVKHVGGSSKLQLLFKDGVSGYDAFGRGRSNRESKNIDSNYFFEWMYYPLGYRYRIMVKYDDSTYSFDSSYSFTYEEDKMADYYLLSAHLKRTPAFKY